MIDKMIMQGRLLLFDKLNIDGSIVSKDCKLKIPEKVPCVIDFNFIEPSYILGFAKVGTDKEGLIVEINVTNMTRGSQMFNLFNELHESLGLGGYYSNVKRDGKLVTSMELKGVSITFWPVRSEYRINSISTRR